jgi:hypothetical protein
LVLRSDVAEVKFHPGSAWFGPRRNERVLIEISLVRELDDAGAVLQGKLFLVCETKASGKGLASWKKADLAGQRWLVIAIEITGRNRKYM